jgi:hypothetical protein
MDPRVKTPEAELARQFTDSQQAAAAVTRVSNAVRQGSAIEKQLGAMSSSREVQHFRQRLAQVLGPPPLGYGAPSTPLSSDVSSLRYLSEKLNAVLSALQSADVEPTPDQEAALSKYERALTTTENQWKEILKTDLPNLNRQLNQAGQKQISAVPDPEPDFDYGDDNDRDR